MQRFSSAYTYGANAYRAGELRRPGLIFSGSVDAEGCREVRESEVTWSIAERVAAACQFHTYLAELSVQVPACRTVDRSVVVLACFQTSAQRSCPIGDVLHLIAQCLEST